MSLAACGSFAPNGYHEPLTLDRLFKFLNLCRILVVTDCVLCHLAWCYDSCGYEELVDSVVVAVAVPAADGAVVVVVVVAAAAAAGVVVVVVAAAAAAAALVVALLIILLLLLVVVVALALVIVAVVLMMLVFVAGACCLVLVWWLLWLWWWCPKPDSESRGHTRTRPPTFKMDCFMIYGFRLWDPGFRV